MIPDEVGAICAILIQLALVVGILLCVLWFVSFWVLGLVATIWWAVKHATDWMGRPKK